MTPVLSESRDELARLVSVCVFQLIYILMSISLCWKNSIAERGETILQTIGFDEKIRINSFIIIQKISERLSVMLSDFKTLLYLAYCDKQPDLQDLSQKSYD